MNSKHIIILLILQISIFGYAQDLSKEVREDFCKSAIVNYYYGTDNFRNLMNISAKKIGLNTPSMFENAIKNLCSNIKLQDEFFKNLNEVSRGLDKEQYISIGMNPHNVKILYDYVLLKYHPIDNKNENNKSEIIDDFVKDTIIINKKALLQSIYPKTTFLNDTLVFRTEDVTYIEGGNGKIEYKTSLIKEYLYFDEKEDEERVKIILFSNNEKGIAYFDILTMVNLEDKGYRSLGSSKRINIEKNKLNNINFKTIKENGNTYFGLCYTNENNEKVIDYYNINLSLVKTILESKTTSKQIEENSNETKENEPALIKDIFLKNGKSYISLVIIQIEYSENDYKIINQNQKIRIFEFTNEIIITNNNCIIIDENNYLINNKEKHISKKNNEFCMFTSVDGIITEINFGCWN